MIHFQIFPHNLGVYYIYLAKNKNNMIAGLIFIIKTLISHVLLHIKHYFWYMWLDNMKTLFTCDECKSLNFTECFF